MHPPIVSYWIPASLRNLEEPTRKVGAIWRNLVIILRLSLALETCRGKVVFCPLSTLCLYAVQIRVHVSGRYLLHTIGYRLVRPPGIDCLLHGIFFPFPCFG